MERTIIEIEGRKVWASPQQVNAISALLEARKGGMAAVEEYSPSTGWETRPVQNIQFISRVDYTKMRARKRAALEALSLADVKDAIADDPKLAALPAAEQRSMFSEAVNAELASIDRTDSGDRSDGHRKGHDACYINIDTGVKVHLVTEKMTDGPDKGLKRPVLTDGIPTVDSIMVSAFIIHRKTLVEGEQKKVNSRPLTLMKQAVARAIDKPGISLKTLSLKHDNFGTVRVDHQTIIPEGLSA